MYENRGSAKMSFLEIIMISVGLAMDAFAVSVGKGLSITNMKFIHGVIVGGYFGGFQALMPFLGYLFGNGVGSNVVDYFSGMITFLILSFIGLKMIKGADEVQDLEKDFSFKTMIVLAIATSIDAFAVGITFAFMKVNIFSSIFMIGIITFLISFLGIKIGNMFGNKCRKSAQLIGRIDTCFYRNKIFILKD